MRIGLEEFRAFARTGMMDVKPITFLVGENSSGKTSFLAALNYIWRMNSGLSNSFSSPPFDIGSFDEIVHRVRGRKRPDCFTIYLDETMAFSASDQYNWLYEESGQERRLEKGLCRFVLTFKPNVGDAVLASIYVSFDDLGLSIDVEGDLTVKLARGKQVIYDSSGDEVGNLPLTHVQRTAPQLRMEVIDGFLQRLVFNSAGLLGTKEKPDWSMAGELARIHTVFTTFLRSLPSSVLASAPVRSNPSRVYARSDPGRSPEGSHTPQALFRIKKTDNARWLRMKRGIEEFGQLSGMFQKIDVTGFRSTSSSPFQINVTNRGRQSNIMDVGYGVSQALPILADLIEAGPRSAFLFQQPEVHLHPQAQAALGTLFVRYATSKKDSIIVAETHSDYIIDRVRYEIGKGNFRSDNVRILYFESAGSESKIYEVGIDHEGNIKDVPQNYRDFFIQEQYRVLGLEDVSDN